MHKLVGDPILTFCALATAALQIHQGQYFRWSVPAGWKARESMSGVEMFSADGQLKADWAILLRSPGSSRPDAFALNMLARVPGYSNVRLVKIVSQRQKASAYPGVPWNVAEMQLSYQYRGVPMQSLWTCGVLNMQGYTHDAVLSGYAAPQGQFDQAKLWLSQVINSVAITKTRQVAGNDTLIRPKKILWNMPLESYDGAVGGYRNPNRPDEILSKPRSGE